MKKSSIIAALAVIGLCHPAGDARGQDNAPAPPIIVQPAPAPGQPGAPPATAPAPGTTRTGTLAPAPPIAIPGIRSVMVFPFEVAASPPMDSTVDLRQLGPAVAEAVRKGLEQSRVYTTTLFSPDSVLVERARQEAGREMTPALTNVINSTTTAVDQAHAQTITRLTGMQALMLGSIEAYTYDKANNRVEIVGQSSILDALNGNPLRNAAVSGSATGSAGQSELQVAQAAATDLAQRLLTGLAVPPGPQDLGGIRPPRRKPLTQEQEGARRRFPGWIVAGVLLGIVATSVD